jgi:hypothetical protein
VTVCIAAVCEDGRGIVAACDRLMSAGSTSSDSILKAHRLGTHWLAMVSGNDISHVTPILKRAETQLAETRYMPEEVEGALAAAYADETRKEAERTLLAPLGLTMKEFCAGPGESWHPGLYAQLTDQIQRVTLGCDFLVCSFDLDHMHEAAILHVSGARHRASSRRYWLLGDRLRVSSSNLLVEFPPLRSPNEVPISSLSCVRGEVHG